MDESKKPLMNRLIKENNTLIQRLVQMNLNADFSYSSVTDLGLSVGKLLQIVQGIPCDRESLSFEVALSYNYSLVLLKSAQLNISSPPLSFHPTPVGGAPATSVYKILKDLLFRVSELRRRHLEAESSSEEVDVLSEALVELLLSVWCPGSAKLLLLRTAAAYCLWLLNVCRVRPALELCRQLVDQILPRLGGLLQVESCADFILDMSELNKCPMPSQETSPVVSDSVLVITAISYSHLVDWNQCLVHLRQVETYPLKLYCQYAEGYILYEQHTYDSAVGLLNSVIKRDDLPLELSLNVRNLIGCCLSLQGKHRSAVHVFKKCLEDDIEFVLALYNIALQYQKLRLFDAEVEALQLLAKLLDCCNTSSKGQSDHILLLADGAKKPLLSVQPEITRHQVLYILATRCLDLNRYSDAVGAFLELLSLQSSVGSIFNGPSRREMRLPSASTIYCQAIYAGSRGNDLEQTVTLCDAVLRKTQISSDNSSDIWGAVEPRQRSVMDVFGNRSGDQGKTFATWSGFHPCPEASLQSMRGEAELLQRPSKRMREKEETGEPEDTEDGKEMTEKDADAVSSKLFDVAILLYKSSALVRLGKTSEALLCVDRAIGILELGWTDAVKHEEGGQRQPCAKKIKLDKDTEVSDGCCSWRQMLSDSYNLKCLILVTLGCTKDALHWSRLAYQLKSDDTEKAYNLVLLLIKLQRRSEAISLWLSHRNLLTVTNDTLQIDALLKQCSAVATKVTSTEAKDSAGGRYCVLDVEALKMLKSTKQSYW